MARKQQGGREKKEAGRGVWTMNRLVVCGWSQVLVGMRWEVEEFYGYTLAHAMENQIPSSNTAKKQPKQPLTNASAYFCLQFANKIHMNQLIDNKIISMWNLLPSSKLLQQKQQDKDYQSHLRKLKTMKSTITIQPPQQPVFVFTKPKTEMLRRDKLLMIDRENDILNSKLQQIHHNKQYKDNKLRPESQQLKTLNQVVNNQQLTNIYRENQRICNKLLEVQTFYPTFKLLRQSQISEKVRNNISENARRSLSLRSNSAKQRPQSSSRPRSSKFYRSRISKFDIQGNSSQQKISILYKLSSHEMTRPSTAPSIKKTDHHHQGPFEMPKMAETQEFAKEFQTNLPSEHQTERFSPR